MEEVAAKKPNSSDTARGSEQNGIVPPIFLSHSRTQKSFVRELYHALTKAHHRPYFDTDSLRGGDLLSESIEKAVRGCELGVVVLSNEYLTTRWPMLELEMMLENSNTIILPVFYELRPEDLKSDLKLDEWREEWKKIEGIDVGKWESAVERICNRTGQVFPPNMGKDEFIEKIVEAICDIIPPTIMYDLSRTKGQESLVEVIKSRFIEAESVCKSNSGACAIGLHGIGGIGKTTLSQMMVNFYMQEYAGRCVLVEFPSHRNMNSILVECKKVLERCSTLDKNVLARIDHFNKVRP